MAKDGAYICQPRMPHDNPIVRIGKAVMRLILPSLLLFAGAAAPERPSTYLLSIESVGLKPGERIESFAVDARGVDLRAVCHIPNDWEIAVERSGPGGRLNGRAGHGASWIDAGHMSEFSAIALIALDRPVQSNDRVDAAGVAPATFAGRISIRLPNADKSRQVRVTDREIRLKPAGRCPNPR